MAFLAVLLARVFGINWEELHPADRARLDGKFGEFLDKMALIGIILISFWWQGKDMKVGCVVVGDFLSPTFENHYPPPHPTPPRRYGNPVLVVSSLDGWYACCVETFFRRVFQRPTFLISSTRFGQSIQASDA